MKKLLILIMVFSVCAFPFSNAYAAPTAYSINEENMSVTIPDGWDVFTQSSDEKDARLSKYGLDERLISNMKSNNISLEALYLKPFTEINVGCSKNDSSEMIYNLKVVDDSNMEFLAQSIINKLKEAKNANISDHKFYSNNNTKYVVTNYIYVENDNKVNAIQYYTIVNGKMINISLFSYNEPISDKMSDLIKSTADSLTYVENPSPNASAFASLQAQASAEASNDKETSTGPAATKESIPASGTANAPDRTGFILIVLGGGVVVALIITGIVIFIKKKGRAKYGSREIVISSDGYNTDTPDNSGGFIPPEITDRNGTWNTDNTGEVRAAQPEDTKKTDGTEETQEAVGGYQPDETNETGATDQADTPKTAEAFCNQCGAKVPENSRFCYRCGAPIHRD